MLFRVRCSSVTLKIPPQSSTTASWGVGSTPSTTRYSAPGARFSTSLVKKSLAAMTL